MRAVIVFATKHGSTAEMAAAIAESMELTGVAVDVRGPQGALNLASYDAVVLGSGIYMGHWLPEMRRFVTDHAEELSDMPVWLFSSGPLGAQPVPEDQPAGERLAAFIGAEGHAAFAGHLDRDVLGLREHALVNLVHAASGDYRDWMQIRQWGTVIGGLIMQPGRVRVGERSRPAFRRGAVVADRRSPSRRQVHASARL